MARTETFHNMGFRLTYPDVFDHTLGQVSPMAFLGDNIKTANRTMRQTLILSRRCSWANI